MNIEEDLDRMY